METYPFIVKNKLVKVKATGLNNAIDRVVTKHPNKIVNFKHAKNMDLISAKVEAAKESKAQGKPVYVIIDADGEADISMVPLKGVAHKYVGGTEDKNFEPQAAPTSSAPKKKSIPAQSEKAQKIISKTKNENVMSTKKSSPKKAAKKAAAPKTKAPKVEKIIRGNNMALTAEEWKKIDALLAKTGESFSSFSRNLVLSKIK